MEDTIKISYKKAWRSYPKVENAENIVKMQHSQYDESNSRKQLDHLKNKLWKRISQYQNKFRAKYYIMNYLLAFRKVDGLGELLSHPISRDESSDDSTCRFLKLFLGNGIRPQRTGDETVFEACLRKILVQKGKCIDFLVNLGHAIRKKHMWAHALI